MKLTNLKSIKDSTVKFAKTFVTSIFALHALLVIATTLVTTTTATSAYASRSTQTAQSTPKVYHGANWDNSKSYVIRKVRYHLKDKKQAIKHKEQGKATWYCCYRKGTKTADGGVFSQHKLTAAHKTLPFGSQVRVTNLKNGKSVIVEITDRGPFKPGKIIDLTPAAFAKIDSKSTGVANVKLDVLGFKY
nr:MAG TPA: lipoprotein [Caudoviricetes sp.]